MNHSEKITGVKSVDLAIKLVGHGVINWNGGTEVTNEKGKVINNHTMPKLRGYTNLSGKIKEENGYEYRKHPEEFNLKETPLYISSNCFRHHLFKEQAYDLHFAKTSNALQLVCSLTGLVRGYMITKTKAKNKTDEDSVLSLKKQSALFVEDSVDKLNNGNLETFSRAGDRDSQKGIEREDGSTTKANSFYTKITFGDTEYHTFASLNIEELQFISLDNKFDRQALAVAEKDREVAAQTVQDFICSLNEDDNLHPTATFGLYVRKGTIYREPQEGILLNSDAVQVLINVMLNKIKNLCIRQGQGYAVVTDIEVDYNDSDKMMRLKGDKDLAFTEPAPQSELAVYYERVDVNE